MMGSVIMQCHNYPAVLFGTCFVDRIVTHTAQQQQPTTTHTHFHTHDYGDGYIPVVKVVGPTNNSNSNKETE